MQRQSISATLFADRAMDVANEDGGPRASMAAMFRPDTPIPSLRDALAELASLYPKLDPDTGVLVSTAKDHVEFADLTEKHPSLSEDDCVAIVLYTMEDDPPENSPYFALNKALRLRNRTAVKPWQGYIWLLLNALKKLPVSPTAQVVRGCKKSPSELSLNLTEGRKLTWNGFSSTASKVDVMSTFMGTEGPRTMFQIELTEPCARDVAAFSLFPQESEVLLPPNVRFKIVSWYDAGGGLTMVQLKQIASTDPILSFGASTGAAEAITSTQAVTPQVMDHMEITIQPEKSSSGRRVSCCGLCVESEAAAAKRAAAEAAAAEQETLEAFKRDFASGLTLAQLKAKGYVKGMQALGVTCIEAKAVGYTLEEISIGGFVEGLKAAEFSLQDVMAAGYKLPEILRAGFSKAEAAQAGYSEAQLQTALQLAKDDGYPCKQARDAGFSASDYAMQSKPELYLILEGGFSKAEAEQAGYSEGYHFEQALSQCISRSREGDVKDDLYWCKQARDAGFSCREYIIALEKAYVYLGTWGKETTVLRAGFSKEEVIRCGFSHIESALREAKSVGYTASDAKQGGFSPDDIREAGYTVSEAKQGGFSFREMREGGYTASHLKDSGFSLREMREAGFVKGLKGAGFSISDAMQCGYSTVSELKVAGYTPLECRLAGFTFAEGRAAGYDFGDQSEHAWNLKTKAEGGQHDDHPYQTHWDSHF